MTSSRSEPRPALRKAADGATHPAMPRWEAPPTAPDSSVPDPGGPSAFEIANPPPTAKTDTPQATKPGKKKAKKGKGKGHGKTAGPGHAASAAASVEMVKVSTRVPKGLRRQARRKAEAEGRTLEEALAHLVQVWAGGGHH